MGLLCRGAKGSGIWGGETCHSAAGLSARLMPSCSPPPPARAQSERPPEAASAPRDEPRGPSPRAALQEQAHGHQPSLGGCCPLAQGGQEAPPLLWLGSVSPTSEYPPQSWARSSRCQSAPSFPKDPELFLGATRPLSATPRPGQRNPPPAQPSPARTQTVSQESQRF